MGLFNAKEAAAETERAKKLADDATSLNQVLQQQLDNKEAQMAEITNTFEARVAEFEGKLSQMATLVAEAQKKIAAAEAAILTERKERDMALKLAGADTDDEPAPSGLKTLEGASLEDLWGEYGKRETNREKRAFYEEHIRPKISRRGR